jgi:hypothetical protein
MRPTSLSILLTAMTLPLAVLEGTSVLAQAQDNRAGIGVAPRTFVCALQDQEAKIRRERDRIAAGGRTMSPQPGAVDQNLGDLQNAISAALAFVQQKAPVELSRRDAYNAALQRAREAAGRVVNAGSVPPQQVVSTADDVLHALDDLRQVAVEGTPPGRC